MQEPTATSRNDIITGKEVRVDLTWLPRHANVGCDVM